MKNPYKNYETRTIKYAPHEYKELIEALEMNESEKVKDIIFKIYFRKHLL